MIKILHTADWHPKSQGTIGGKLSINPETGLSWTLTDFTKSMLWLIEVAERERPDALVIAGDVFDVPNPTADENMVVMDFLKHIRVELGVPIFAIAGNHDMWQSGSGSPATQLIKFAGTVCARTPTTYVEVVRDQRVRFDFLPYPSRGRIMASMDLHGMSHEEVDALINQKLSDIVQGLTVEHKPDELCILIAHGSVSMAKINEQPRSLAHDIQLPVKEWIDPYHYVALGHIHQMQQVYSNSWYCGSLLRQSFGEEQEAKGVLMVEVGHATSHVKFLENPYSRKYQTVKLNELDGPHDGDLSRVYRVKDKVTAEEFAKYQEDILDCQNLFPYFQVDVEIEKEDRQRDSGMTNGMTPCQALERCIERQSIQDPLLSEIRTTHQAIMEELR